MSKILTIGSVSQDIFFPTADGITLDTPDDILSQKKIAFELGAKYHINERFESLGGCSINVAAGLARLGEDVSCYTTIGDDATGQWISKELKKIGVGKGNVIVEKGCKSDLSAIVVDKNSSDRVIFSNQVANQNLIVDKDKIGSPDWIFIGDLNGQWEKNLDTIIIAAKEKNIPVAFNPRQKTIHDNAKKIVETIAQCELLFVNKDEALEILSSNGYGDSLHDEKQIIGSLHEIGAKIVALTDGTNGAWGFDGKNLLHAPAVLAAGATDSTGAGDAFTSGFLAAHVKGKAIAEALKWGIANSSSKLKEYGGQKGLLFEKDIEKFTADITAEKLY